MILSHHLIPTTLLIATLVFGCTTTPTPTDSPVNQQPPTQQESNNQQDPLQTAEHWLKTGQSFQSQPIHTVFWSETQSWNSPHVTRLYLATPDDPDSPSQYNAIITAPNEPPDHALQLTITQQQNTWHITNIQQIPARQLWPRF